MQTEIKIGITEGSVLNTDQDAPLELEEKFRLVKESGVYDYYDKTPPAEDEFEYARLSDKYELPILAGGWFYQLGRDEALLKSNLELGARLGSKVHNTQIFWRHKDKRPVTNDEIVDIYLRAAAWGDACGCHPTFEVHINMWSEDFRRVIEVADQVESRGVPFRMTLDHSHVIFKMDNPAEEAKFGLGDALKAGELILDPFNAEGICQQWIQRGFIKHAHARAAIPANPRNTAQMDHNGEAGRGVQYPFIQPQPGEYVAQWEAAKLEPWKMVIRQLFEYLREDSAVPLAQISTEFIPFPDYGGGHGYSIFENSVACAKWLRETWNAE